MTKAIDPERVDLAQEFYRNPWGPHSAELQRILNVMRAAPVAGKHVILMSGPYRQMVGGASDRGSRRSGREDRGLELRQSRRRRTGGLQAPLGSAHRAGARSRRIREAAVTKRILGYSDEISVVPGGRIRFMVSCEPGIERYRAEIVRMRSGDIQPKEDRGSRSTRSTRRR